MNDIAPAPLPRTVAWLGYGGLLPFIGLALLIPFDPHHAPFLADALFAYGAVILSFVGALHWGFAIALLGLTTERRNRCFIWSTIPALIAWPALLLVPAEAGPLLIGGFLAHYWQDTRLSRWSSLPAWYLPLRLQLTSVACLTLASGVYFSVF